MRNEYVICCLKDHLSNALSKPELFESVAIAVRYYKDTFKTHCSAPDLDVVKLGVFDSELGIKDPCLERICKLYSDLMYTSSEVVLGGE